VKFSISILTGIGGAKMVGKLVDYPKGPKALLPWSHILDLRNDPIGFVERAYASHPDIAYFRMAGLDVYLLTHPDYIRDVLVTQQEKFHKGSGFERVKRLLGEGLLTSEDEFHMRQRRLVQPAFHRQRIASYGSIMAQSARKIGESWTDGETRDMTKEMAKLTLTVVSQSLFGANVDHEAEEIGEALNEIIDQFNLVLVPMGEFLDRFRFVKNGKMKRSRERLDTTVYRMIRERRAANEDRGDVLSMLLMAQDAEGDGTGMTDEQVRDEVMTMFLAGHETITDSMSFTWYLLSQHPEVVQKLQQELKTVLNGRTPSFEDLPKLEYTNKVFSESMRLYPPGWIMGREVMADYQAGDYLIKKGSLILVSQWLMHRSPLYFKDPLQFNPDRWTPAMKEALSKFVYFPFGAGQRMCIGESFAWMEGAMILATLAQDWEMALAPGHKVEPEPLITLRPKNGTRMVLKKRVS
jgi:cytochrome P450